MRENEYLVVIAGFQHFQVSCENLNYYSSGKFLKSNICLSGDFWHILPVIRFCMLPFNLTVRFILLLARIRFWYQWCWQEGSFCALSVNQSPSNEQKGLHLK